MKSIKNRLVESVERLGWILAPLTNNTAFLGHLTALIAAIMVMVGCSTVRYVPVEGKTEVKTHYVDSVRWNVRDSVVLIERSVFKDYAGLLDTLRLEGASGTVACAWNEIGRAHV